jgi:glycosyltransferase involved in cell wall biosynthesis
VPYKRLDVAIRACSEVGATLKIVGRGPEEPRLRRLAQTARADVEFSGWLEDNQIRDLYRRSRAVLMPGVEDFGMVPVEAQACGRPVVALAVGGAVESVVDGVTGVLVRDPSVEAFTAALRDVSSGQFDSAAIRRHAESFSKARFQQQFRTVIESAPDSESRGPDDDSREVSARRPIDPDDRRNAARYRQRRGKPAARETER